MWQQNLIVLRVVTMAVVNNVALALLVAVAIAASVLSLPPVSLAVMSPYVRLKTSARLSLLEDHDNDSLTPEQEWVENGSGAHAFTSEVRKFEESSNTWRM